MSFDALIRRVFRRVREHVAAEDSQTQEPYQANTSKLTARLSEVFLLTYLLGFTSFGGPPVHFQKFHRSFVDGKGSKTPWIDEQTALPGPASTKMLFNIAQIHAGLVPAFFVFLLWSLPGAIAMFGLALGVHHIKDTLPGPAYALFSGLNAAIVGIIALYAVQLARKAITDPLTRILVAFGGCAGMCYSVLWYFAVLLVLGGIATVTWDFIGQDWMRRWRQGRHRRRQMSSSSEPENGPEVIL